MISFWNVKNWSKTTLRYLTLVFFAFNWLSNIFEYFSLIFLENFLSEYNEFSFLAEFKRVGFKNIYDFAIFFQLLQCKIYIVVFTKNKQVVGVLHNLLLPNAFENRML